MPSPLSPGEIATIEEYQTKVNKSAGWFFFIAGLSIVNTVLVHTEQSLSFVIGLTITQFIDGFGIGIADAVDNEAITPWLPYLFSAISICVSLTFVLFGWFGRKCMRGAYLFGIILYLMDSLLLVLYPTFMSVIFHIIAVIALFQGWRLMGQIKEIQNNPTGDTFTAEPVLEADPS